MSQSFEWEVEAIIDHKFIRNNKNLLYLVKWKPTFHENYEKEILPFRKDMKNIEIIYEKNKRIFKVSWNNSWLSKDNLENSDFLLGLYLLLQTKKTAFNIVQNQ